MNYMYNYFYFLQKCIEYSLEVDYVGLNDLITKIMAQMILTPIQKVHLSKLVGTEHYVEIENTIEAMNS